MQLKTTLYDVIGYIIPGLLLPTLSILGWANYTSNLKGLCGLWNTIHKFTLIDIICIFGLSYLIGHIISSVSSLIVERWLCKNHNNTKILDSEILKAYEKKFERLYNMKANQNNFRLSVCHVESKQPQVHSTAFVFQSFYGMARNISFLFCLFGVWELLLLIHCVSTKAWQAAFFSLQWTLGAFFLGTAMFYVYKRFIKYYRTHIICGFLLNED